MGDTVTRWVKFKGTDTRALINAEDFHPDQHVSDDTSANVAEALAVDVAKVGKKATKATTKAKAKDDDDDDEDDE